MAQQTWSLHDTSGDSTFVVDNPGSWKRSAVFWFRKWDKEDSEHAACLRGLRVFFHELRDSLAAKENARSFYTRFYERQRNRADSLVARIDSLQQATPATPRGFHAWTVTVASGGGMQSLGIAAGLGDLALRAELREDETDGALERNPRGRGIATFSAGKRIGNLVISGQAAIFWEVRSSRISGTVGGSPISLQMSGQDTWRSSKVGVRVDYRWGRIAGFAGVLRGNGETIWHLGASLRIAGPVSIGGEVWDSTPLGRIEIRL